LNEDPLTENTSPLIAKLMHSHRRQQRPLGSNFRVMPPFSKTSNCGCVMRHSFIAQTRLVGIVWCVSLCHGSGIVVC